MLGFTRALPQGCRLNPGHHPLNAMSFFNIFIRGYTGRTALDPRLHNIKQKKATFLGGLTDVFKTSFKHSEHTKDKNL